MEKYLEDNYTYVFSDEEAIRAAEQYMNQGIHEYQIVYDVKNVDEIQRDEIRNCLNTQI